MTPKQWSSAPAMSFSWRTRRRGACSRSVAAPRCPSGTPSTSPARSRSTGRPTREVEALARLPDGSLLALSEGAWEQDGLHSLVRVGDDGAQLLQYRCPQGFQPTDADVAGGRLFVLERRISLLRGWQSRVVAVPLETLDDPAASAIQGQELAVISGAGLGENYEALSVEQTPDGAFRMLIVADDNFNEFQRTLLLELGWRP